MYAIRSYYAGAWWAASDGGHALQSALTDEGLGQADFWVALGYDFVRFAGRIGTLPSGWTPELVNRITSYNVCYTKLLPIRGCNKRNSL